MVMRETLLSNYLSMEYIVCTEAGHYGTEVLYPESHTRFNFFSEQFWGRAARASWT
jgi:hypothetical protein